MEESAAKKALANLPAKTASEAACAAQVLQVAKLQAVAAVLDFLVVPKAPTRNVGKQALELQKQVVKSDVSAVMVELTAIECSLARVAR